LHRRAGAAGDERLDLLARLRHVGDAGCDVEQLRVLGAHQAVPPTVRAGTRRVGTPSPTGTPWPSLPHVPGLPMAKSSPTASMLPRTAGPLPRRLPSRMGSVIWPSSIRYASVMPNTKSPVAVFTWPPPRWATYTPLGVEAMMSSGLSGPART